ncbi:MAG: hypothetical protein AAF281_00605 [Pseudomonadota bacterium]
MTQAGPMGTIVAGISDAAGARLILRALRLGYFSFKAGQLSSENTFKIRGIRIFRQRFLIQCERKLPYTPASVPSAAALGRAERGRERCAVGPAIPTLAGAPMAYRWGGPLCLGRSAAPGFDAVRLRPFAGIS